MLRHDVTRQLTLPTGIFPGWPMKHRTSLRRTAYLNLRRTTMRAELNLERLIAIEGSRRTITLVRSDLASAGEAGFTTFSPESVLALASQMQAWTVSRLLRAAAEENSMPRVMEVEAAMWSSTDATLVPISVQNERGPDARFALQLHREWPHEWYTPGIEPFAQANLEALREAMHTWLVENLVGAASKGPLVQGLTVTVDACRLA